MGWVQRRNERRLARAITYCVGKLNDGEEAYDVQTSMFEGPRGWVEGDLLLTSDRAVFKPRKGGWLFTFTLPHAPILDIRDLGGSPFTAGITRVYLVKFRGPHGDHTQRIDTSASFMANWTTVLQAWRTQT